MDELISKRAVIEAIEKARANVGHNLERSIGKSIIEILDDVGRDVNGLPSALGTNLAEDGTDCISRQQAINALDECYCGGEDSCGEPWIYKENAVEAIQMIEPIPSAQPQRTCVNCGRTVNNGGWYADGRTRCPIEEHYALPKDGYCHLWEKRNVTDDDYPERREE
jgi:hypothetical protein